MRDLYLKLERTLLDCRQIFIINNNEAWKDVLFNLVNLINSPVTEGTNTHQIYLRLRDSVCDDLHKLTTLVNWYILMKFYLRGSHTLTQLFNQCICSGQPELNLQLSLIYSIGLTHSHEKILQGIKVFNINTLILELEDNFLTWKFDFVTLTASEILRRTEIDTLMFGKGILGLFEHSPKLIERLLNGQRLSTLIFLFDELSIISSKLLNDVISAIQKIVPNSTMFTLDFSNEGQFDILCDTKWKFLLHFVQETHASRVFLNLANQTRLNELTNVINSNILHRQRENQSLSLKSDCSRLLWRNPKLKANHFQHDMVVNNDLIPKEVQEYIQQQANYFKLNKK